MQYVRESRQLLTGYFPGSTLKEGIFALSQEDDGFPNPNSATMASEREGKEFRKLSKFFSLIS